MKITIDNEQVGISRTADIRGLAVGLVEDGGLVLSTCDAFTAGLLATGCLLSLGVPNLDDSSANACAAVSGFDGGVALPGASCHTIGDEILLEFENVASLAGSIAYLIELLYDICDSEE